MDLKTAAAALDLAVGNDLSRALRQLADVKMYYDSPSHVQRVQQLTKAIGAAYDAGERLEPRGDLTTVEQLTEAARVVEGAA